MSTNTNSRQAGEWYLSCSDEFTPTSTPKTTDVVGVDLGIKILATLSDGKVFEVVPFPLVGRARGYHP